MYIHLNFVNTKIEVKDMKEKVKKFFIEKKELLIFIGVVVFVFAAVIGIASLALNSKDPVQVNTPPINDTPDDDTPTVDTPDPVTPVVQDKFILPLVGEYKMVRTFFDPTLSNDELASAVILTGNEMIESTGISYAKEDNSSFEVLAVFDGTVVSVTVDELVGTTIEIQHDNKVSSIYSSLTDVSVKEGDKVEQGACIGKASTSISDTEAGVHVHFEVKANSKYMNPIEVYGKEIEEIVEIK